MTTQMKALREQWTRKLHELLQQRRNTDRQIIGLQQMLKGAAVLTEDPIRSELTLDPVPLPPGLEEIRTLGLTEAVRLVLERSGHPLNAKQIRDRLESYEYPLMQSNPMAAVHQVLKRLLKQKEIRTGKAAGKTCYEWMTKFE